MVFQTENFQMIIRNHDMINFYTIYENPMTQKCQFLVRFSKCQRSLRNHAQNCLVLSTPFHYYSYRVLSDKGPNIKSVTLVYEISGQLNALQRKRLKLRFFNR